MGDVGQRGAATEDMQQRRCNIGGAAEEGRGRCFVRAVGADPPRLDPRGSDLENDKIIK